MQPRCNLEPATRARIDKSRHDRGVRPLRQGQNAALPRAVDQRAIGRTRIRDLASRKHDEHAALRQPGAGRPKPAPIFGGSRIKGVHGDDVLAHLRNALQQMIAQQARVLPAAHDRVRQREAVHGTGRVIGDNNHGAAVGDVAQFPIHRRYGDTEARERVANEIAAGKIGVKPVERCQAQQRIEDCSRERRGPSG